VETTEQDSTADKDAVVEEQAATAPAPSHDDSENTHNRGRANRRETNADEERNRHAGSVDETDAADKSRSAAGGCSEFTRPPGVVDRGVGSSSSMSRLRRSELRRCHHNAVEHVSSLPLDPPSIVVSGLNVDDDREPCSTNTDEEDDDDSGEGGQIWTTAAAQDAEERSSTAAFNGEEDGADDDQVRGRIGRETERAGRTCVALAVCTALSLPYAVAGVWNALATGPRYTAFNVSQSAAAVMTVMAAVLPPLLVWSERRRTGDRASKTKTKTAACITET